MDTNVRTNYLTRALSLLLAIVMAFSSIPLFHIEADAESYEYALFPMQYLYVTQGGEWRIFS